MIIILFGLLESGELPDRRKTHPVVRIAEGESQHAAKREAREFAGCVDIAGKGVADHESMLEAIRVAVELAGEGRLK